MSATPRPDRCTRCCSTPPGAPGRTGSHGSSGRGRRPPIRRADTAACPRACMPVGRRPRRCGSRAWRPRRIPAGRPPGVTPRSDRCRRPRAGQRPSPVGKSMCRPRRPRRPEAARSRPIRRRGLPRGPPLHRRRPRVPRLGTVDPRTSRGCRRGKRSSRPRGQAATDRLGDPGQPQRATALPPVPHRQPSSDWTAHIRVSRAEVVLPEPAAKHVAVRPNRRSRRQRNAES